MRATQRVFVLGIVLAGVGCNGVDNSNFHLETDGGIVGTGQPGNPIRLADTGIMLMAVSPLKADGMAALGGMLTLSCPTCLTGIGFPGVLAKFTGPGALGESILFDGATSVGIGTRTPHARVDIVGTFGNGADGRGWGLEVRDESPFAEGVGGGVLFRGNKDAMGSRGEFGAIRGAKENALETNSAGQLRFYTVPHDMGGLLTERMRIDSFGNVGIGTTAPKATLHIQDSTDGSQLILGNSAPFFSYLGVDHLNRFNLQDGASNTRLLVNLTTGNVGIGTATPSAALDVNGEINLNSTLTFSGTGVRLWVDGNTGAGDPCDARCARSNSVCLVSFKQKTKTMVACNSNTDARECVCIGKP